MIARHFLADHPRAGGPTYFAQKIHDEEKLHTIRGNYLEWKRKIDEVNAGEAYLSVREWVGKPYNSKQKEMFVFGKEDGIGVQELTEPANFVAAVIDGKNSNWEDVVKNDGLSFEDFDAWFKNVDENTPPMAIIHFTKFRY